MRARSPALNYVFAICGLLASVGDFIVTFLLGHFYPGYDFVYQSESFLGTSESPVAPYMNTWGVIFFLLLSIFAYGLHKTIFRGSRWQAVGVACIFLYGLGEGAGSGLFPYDHINGALTTSGILHSLFGGLAGFSIALAPFAGTKIFSSNLSPRMNAYSWTVFVSGLILIIVFLVSERGLISYKGFWQRIFILDYHLYLLVLAVLMTENKSRTESSPQR
jgi:uncharacterized membrane protein YecN with MAPEG domain